ncbi:MAG: hypothetical protein KDD42_09895, partial [Bdellovibrionales bacterium]|nr:hypothetical protein [Bdellovibrionales bacterium]
MAIVLNDSANVNYELHWAALRRNGCSSSDVLPTASISPGHLAVNSKPTLKILQPDARGGADYFSKIRGNPVNMDDARDIVSAENVSSATIFPGNTKFDVYGDFFCATNKDGNDDPYHPVVDEPEITAANRIPSRYRNLTSTFYQDAVQDNDSGSDLRIIACNFERDGNGECLSGDDTFYKGKRWVTLTQDMTKWSLEELLHPNPPQPIWDGDFNVLRVDIQEALSATTYCVDRIELREDDRSDGKFLIAYSLTDSDSAGDDVTVSFFYTQTAGATSGGTPITGAQNVKLSANTRTIEFDTASLANGIYYVYGVATDGLNTFTIAAGGRLEVSHTLAADTTNPVLSLSAPTEGREEFRSSGLVVTGFAIDDTQLALVEVLIDSVYAGSFVPSEYNADAHSAHTTFSDASSAGFFQTISLASITDGSHKVTVRACDTNANCVSEERTVTVKAGTDPAPVTRPTLSESKTIPVGESDITLKIAVSKSGTLSGTVKNAMSCGTNMVLKAARSAAALADDDLGVVLKDLGVPQESTLSFSVSGLKGMKVKGGKGKKAKKKAA